MTPGSPPAPDPTAARRRNQFFRRTYTHLAGAIAAFLIIEAWLLRQPFVPGLVETGNASNWNWLTDLGPYFGGAMVGVGETWWDVLGSRGARAIAYAGLALVVAATAVSCAPMLWKAGELAPGTVPAAALMTVLLTGGLTAAAWLAPRAFRIPPFVIVGSLLFVVLLIEASVAFDSRPIIVAVVLVALAGAGILDTTARLTGRYRHQHVFATFILFLSVGLMFGGLAILFL